MNWLRLTSAIAIVCLLGGCGTKERYYRLNAEAPGRRGSGAVSLGVGPVHLPSYLDRPELVYASGLNEYQIPTDALWAAPLSENISHVLATDLSRLLGAQGVVGYPWPRGRKPGRQIAVDVRQFHAISGKDAVLDCSWRIGNGSRHTTQLHERIEGDGYGPVVAAQSRLLLRLAEQMAQAVGR